MANIMKSKTRIPKAWQVNDLKELIDKIESGSRPKGGANSIGAIPSFGGENIGMDGTINYENVRKVSRAFYLSMPKGHLKSGDVLINKDGANTGKVGLYRNDIFKEACINEHIFLLRGERNKITQEFLYYLIFSSDGQKIIRKNISGSAQPGLKTDFIKNFPALLPMSIKEQKRIADILISIDSVIEKTQTIINQTQTLKKGLMQELFTHGIPGRHKKFKKTEIGMIPSDWELAKLKNVLAVPIRNGYSPYCPECDQGRVILSLNAVTHEGFNSKGFKLAPYDDPKLSEYILKHGDLLVSRSNTRDRVGLAGVYEGDPAECAYPDLLMRVCVNNKTVSPFWAEQCLLSGFGRKYFERNARGTSASMVKINRKILEDFLLGIPDREEQQKILNISKNMQKIFEIEKSQQEHLIYLKSALMQVLLSGKVRVKI